MYRRPFRVAGMLPVLVMTFLSGQVGANPEVPFKARLSGTSVYTFVSPTEVSEDFSGDGVATHLGRFHTEQHHIVNLTGLPLP
jgi:hypothetical protein